ncbi:hypothetical protein INR49_004205 [Caranx melampygus]|nr:hypothetical protein INR49_004205 [Caranx melampygus]
MLMYYWVGVTEAMKTWIKACTVCQSRVPSDAPAPAVHFCLVYGCDASSYSCPELSFHRFPKEAEQRRTWLAAAQRDEGSLRNNSCICSRHFDSSCFMLSEDGQLTLSPDAVPAVVVPAAAREDEAPVPSDDDFLPSNSVDQLLSTTAAAGPSEPGSDPSEVPAQLQEHQYCLTAPHSDSGVQATSGDTERRTTVTEPSFVAYNRIARYLSHRVLPMQSKKSRGVLKKMAKRFGLIDGELMYTRVSPPLRVPRSREEVNSILQQFHDNQGHYSQGICQREITKHFYWSTVTRDVAAGSPAAAPASTGPRGSGSAAASTAARTAAGRWSEAWASPSTSSSSRRRPAGSVAEGCCTSALAPAARLLHLLHSFHRGLFRPQRREDRPPAGRRAHAADPRRSGSFRQVRRCGALPP